MEFENFQKGTTKIINEISMIKYYFFFFILIKKKKGKFA